MITAHGRGVIAGAEEARTHAERVSNVTTRDIRAVAYLTYKRMQEAGYAHITPEDEFVAGFLVGFRNWDSAYILS